MTEQARQNPEKELGLRKKAEDEGIETTDLDLEIVLKQMPTSMLWEIFETMRKPKKSVLTEL